MNPFLLGAIQSECQRQEAPAVLAIEKHRCNEQMKVWYRRLPRVNRLVRRIGVLKQMLEETGRIRYLQETSIVLAGRGHKFEEILAELAQAGVSKSEMCPLPEKAANLRLMGLLLGRNMVFQNLLAWCYLYISCSATLARYFEVICLYAVFTRESARKPKSFWLVIGDLSPQQIALAAAAKAAAHKVISWQSDYLDFKRFPVKPDIAVVLNDFGAKLARMKELDKVQGRVLWRRRIQRMPVQLKGLSEKPVGVLLNAFADKQVLNERLVNVYKALGRPLHLRLHPRSDLYQCDLPDGLVRRPVGETMERFVDSVGLIVCGNTSAQFKALCLGAPVAQIPGLDPILFDHHGYVEKGLVFGVQDISDLSIERVREFYLMPTFERDIHEILGPADGNRGPSLSGLRELATSQCGSTSCRSISCFLV